MKRKKTKQQKWEMEQLKRAVQGQCSGFFSFLLSSLLHFILHSARWMSAPYSLLPTASFILSEKEAESNSPLGEARPQHTRHLSWPPRKCLNFRAQHYHHPALCSHLKDSRKFKMGNVPRRAISTLGSAGLNREILTILEVELELERACLEAFVGVRILHGVYRDNVPWREMGLGRRSGQTALLQDSFYKSYEGLGCSLPAQTGLSIHSIPFCYSF